MKKHFLHSDVKSLNISKKRFVVGIAIGVFYAIAFYSFFYVMRQGARFASVTEHYDIWTFTEEEMNFFNLFFAFVSVIFGQSVCFNFWLDRPRRIFTHRNYRLKNIVNDQRNLNWVFLSWFSKLAFLFVIFFGLTYPYSFYTFNFYPDYKYLFVLFVIVLFFQPWLGLRLAFKRQSKKWLLVSILTVSLFSFGLSKVNLTDHNALTETVLKKNVLINYKLELPESDIHNRLLRRSLVSNIYMVSPKGDGTHNTPVYVMDNTVCTIRELRIKIIKRKLEINEAERNQFVCNLYIHRNIEMKYVNQLKSEISDIGIYKIAFASVPTNAEYPQNHYVNHSLNYRIPGGFLFTPEENYKRLSFVKTIIELKQISTHTFTLNSKTVEKENLKEELKKLIAVDPEHVLKYYVKDNSSYGSYIFCLSTIFESVYELRNDYAKSHFSEEERWEFSEHKREIINKYPIRLFEMTEEMVLEFES